MSLAAVNGVARPTATIVLTTWRNASRAMNDGIRRSMGCDDFADWTSQPHGRYPRRPSPSWAPATFSGRGRSDEDDVLEVSALVFELALPLARIEAAYEGQLVFVYSAPTSTTATPRWIVVRVFSRPITVAEFATVWQHERDRMANLGIVLDEQGAKPSHVWPAPSEVIDGSSYDSTMVAGTPLDVGSIVGTGTQPAASGVHNADRGAEDAERRETQEYPMPDEARFAGVPDAPEPPREHASGEAEAEKIQLTELGNSLRLVARYGRKYRFCRALGGWHVYDGKHWRLDTTCTIHRCAKLVVRGLWAEAAQARDESNRHQLRAHARKSEKGAAIAAMVKLAETAQGVAIDSDAFDADPWVLNCKNGLLDLRTMKLRPHNPADMCKKLAPVSFEEDAAAPIFERTIAEILPDAEVRAFVQRFFGYCLTGVIRERVLALFIGKGRNGKSLIVKLIARLMGDYATYAAPQLLMVKEHGDRHPTELADLCGVRFAAMSEVKEGQTFDVETMKRLTGDEPVKARYMGRDFFTFDATWKLALASNHRPKVKDRTESSWDRLREVPFVVRIADDKEDKQLFEKLCAELPGILNWCLAGCVAWKSTGLGTAGAITAATDDYRAGQDPVAAFFAECVALEPRAQVARKELYEAYEAWARAEGERFPVGTKTFAEAVREKGATDEKSHGIRRWVGVRLKDETERATAAKGPAEHVAN